jgi:hypothetical protein
MTAVMPRDRNSARVGPRRVGAITDRPLRSGAGPSRSQTRDVQRLQKRGEHRRVVALPRSHQHHQRPAPTVTDVVDLGGQPTAGSPDSVVRRLLTQIRVTPRCPPYRAAAWWRAGARG